MTKRSDAPSNEPPVLTTVDQVRGAIRQAKSKGRAVGFVPTMGALHAGHISLIEASRRAGDYVVVSIYVNPTQFGPNEDFRQYPRTFETDRAACRQAGADLVFVPQDSDIYPTDDQTRVRPGSLAETLCGQFRPGHFEGVCTVVAKLLNIVQPDTAYFGQKDAQQAAIIQRMVSDLFMPVRIVVCPLVRDGDGLALSSRNARLTPDQRHKALRLYKALRTGEEQLKTGQRSMGQVIAAMRSVLAEGRPDVTVQYLSIVDPRTLAPISEPKGRVMIAGAVKIGDVRLIDNLLVDV